MISLLQYKRHFYRTNKATASQLKILSSCATNKESVDQDVLAVQWTKESFSKVCRSRPQAAPQNSQWIPHDGSDTSKDFFIGMVHCETINTPDRNVSICDRICEKGSSTHIQFYELGRP